MLDPVAARSSPFTAPPFEPDGRILIHNVSWASYVAMSEALGQSGSHARLTYLGGALEIMTNSRDHELLKTLLARLLEAWADETGVELEGYGSTTFRKEAEERGLEPDECYCVGAMLEVPEIAIEVVVSSGLLDKLEVYRGLGVPEVWVFERGALTVYRLYDGAYRTQHASEVLPRLDLAHLASFVRLDSLQSAAVRAYRAELRARTR
jgi:Uma2 family endonuclease